MSGSIWKKVKYFVLGQEDDEDAYEDTYEETADEVITLKTNEEPDRGIVTDQYKRPQRSHLVDINNSNHMKVIVYKPKNILMQNK